jgi:arylsulfatase A-like enzyme
MLAEGGIRVPYLMRGNGKIPAGQIIRTPVTSLDVAATSAAAAGIERPGNFDGLNLLPMLATGSPLADRALTWRFWRQSAIRKGNWKLLKFSDRASYLFDLSSETAFQAPRAASHAAAASPARVPVAKHPCIR